MKLLVVRHGTAEDKDEFARTGKSDDLRPLTPAGKREMRDIARGIREVVSAIDVLLTSPLVRAMQTAEIVGEEYDREQKKVEWLRPDAPYEEFARWALRRRGPRHNFWRLRCRRFAVHHASRLTIVIGGLVASSATAFAQMAMFRGGPAHTGEYRTRGVPAFGGLQWRVQTGGPVRSSPVIDGSTIYIGSGDGNVYAINANTGTVRWRHATDAAVASTPAVSNGLVFVNGNDGRFRALRATDGRLVWSFASGAAMPLKWGYESGEIYTSSPAVDGNTVVFGSQDGHVYALDARTGRERWRFRTGGRVYASPAIAAGMVFAADQGGSVFALTLTS